MEKYEMDGETYMLIKGKWVNSGYTVVSKEEMYKLNQIRLSKIDFGSKETSELINLAQSMKDSEDYVYSVKVFDELLRRNGDAATVNKILPRYTSILRKLDRPQDAIDMFEKYFEMYGKSVYSPATFTSVAAAYCDIGDSEKARQMANCARGMLNGNAGPELISVYKRIKSMEY